MVEAANGHQLTRKESNRFELLVKLLETSESGSLLLAALSFINALVNGSNDWDTRNTLRQELDARGLKDAFRRIRSIEDEEADILDAQIGTLIMN